MKKEMPGQEQSAKKPEDSRESGSGKKPARKRKGQNRQILHITYVFVIMFCVLIGYYVYFIVVKSEEVSANPYNSDRIEKEAEKVTRGSILSKDGEVLALSWTDTDGEEIRFYPYGSMFAHTVGYSTRGTTGIESVANGYLQQCDTRTLEQFYNELIGEKNTGNTVVTTLDLNLQQVLYESMEGYTGAAVVLEADTGKVLAMVSTPDFDPNTINQTYSDIIADSSNTNLLNRATQGVYSPGSVFKLMTLLEYIRENPNTWEDFSYTCPGSIEVDGVTISCSGGTAHGTVDARRALELSCNGAFIQMGLSLDLDSFAETCRQAGFNQNIDFELSAKSSSFTLDSSATDFQIAQTAFGQGETLVTPLHICMIVSAIANDGIMNTPYIIERVESEDGTLLEQFSSPSSSRIMSSKEAGLIAEMMVGVVNNGTGSAVQSSQYQAAAKTGSAQYDSVSETNAWFVGFAPWSEEDGKAAVAVSIVLENGGSGGSNAGPIAKKVFDAYIAENP